MLNFFPSSLIQQFYILILGSYYAQIHMSIIFIYRYEISEETVHQRVFPPLLGVAENTRVCLLRVSAWSSSVLAHAVFSGPGDD